MTEPDVAGPMKEIMRGRSETVIDARWVERINSRHRAEKRILALTKSSFSLYQTKTFSRIPKTIKHFTWFELKKLEATPSKTLNFTFNSDEIVISTDMDIILTKLMCHFNNIFSKSEMPQLNIPISNSDVEPPFKRGISRLRARLFAERPTVPEDLLKTYQDFLKS